MTHGARLLIILGAILASWAAVVLLAYGLTRAVLAVGL